MMDGNTQTRVKICGLTSLADARVAAKAGADLLGFIFYEPSPRYVPPETVKRIVREIKMDTTVSPRCVGVFVNEPRETIAQIMTDCALDLVQLHGDESPEFMAYFGHRAFKAQNPRSLDEAQADVQTYLLQTAAPFILLDAYHPTLRGGTGHTADWSMAAKIAQAHPLLLAGGLNLDNVAEAVEIAHPWGIDVSSGVEATKGQKDHAKVKAFIDTVQKIPTLS